MEYIPYRLIRSDRKTVAIRIGGDGTVEVRAPGRMPKSEIDEVVRQHRSWIEANLPKHPPEPKLTEQQVRQLAQQALADLSLRLSRYAPIVGVTYGNVTVRNQRTRWGSCSSRGNLNFNCLLMLVPEDVRNYVVVHELCHRVHMNHSPEFWSLVRRTLPEYEKSLAWLNENGSRLIGRLP